MSSQTSVTPIRPLTSIIEVNATQAAILFELLSKAAAPIAIGREAHNLLDAVTKARAELTPEK